MNRIVRLLGPRSKSSVWSLGVVLLALGAGTALAVTIRATARPVIAVGPELKQRFSTLCGDIEVDACKPRMAEVPPADLAETYAPFEQFLNELAKQPANQRSAVFKQSVSAALGSEWVCPAFDATWAGEPLPASNG